MWSDTRWPPETTLYRYAHTVNLLVVFIQVKSYTECIVLLLSHSQLLQSELDTVQLTVNEQAKRMSELEEEVGAHSSTGKVTRRELDTW